MDGSIPTFICVGAMKCGTTSLHNYLDIHPSICMSSPKETNYFLDRNKKDVDWYRSCFEGEAQEYGESSTNYTKYPAFRNVPTRMHRLLPNIKLLYLVRDPIDRAISHYMHKWARREESRPIDDALTPVEESWYVTVSQYHTQISRYLDYYTVDNIHVIQSERLQNERREVLSEVFEFIGVDPTFESPVFHDNYHASSEKKRASGLVWFFREFRAGRLLTRMGSKAISRDTVKAIKRKLSYGFDRPDPSDGVVERVKEYLKSDVEKLRGLTGRAFSSWKI